jgi:hypothetical protein
MFNHIPQIPSRLNPSFPSTSPFPSADAPRPPFPSPPITVGGGRFGTKRKLSIAGHGHGHGRGTMSMPTSPLGTSINTEPLWEGVSLFYSSFTYDLTSSDLKCGTDD